jgi:hypothetical protein
MQYNHIFTAQDDGGCDAMPVNCTMHYMDNKWCVIGGGGNCFSFGTFYNKPFYLKMNSDLS